ncbi:hypothetical protein GJAV_G00230810 [Gymnothorax javanicus]|nr:hypothetical protein GJAV_G00230810 [Gymnothorax javanicus]
MFELKEPPIPSSSWGDSFGRVESHRSLNDVNTTLTWSDVVQLSGVKPSAQTSLGRLDLSSPIAAGVCARRDRNIPQGPTLEPTLRCWKYPASSLLELRRPARAALTFPHCPRRVLRADD